MKKTITIPGFIYAEKPQSWQDGDVNIIDGVCYQFAIHEYAKTDTKYTTVCTYKLTFDLPEKFNPAEGFIKHLQAEKKKAMADFQTRCTEIDRQISQLQAIEFTPKETT